MDCVCSLCFCGTLGWDPSSLRSREAKTLPILSLAYKLLDWKSWSEMQPQRGLLKMRGWRKRWAARGPKAAQLVENMLIQHVTDSGLNRALLEISRERERARRLEVVRAGTWAWGVGSSERCFSFWDSKDVLLWIAVVVAQSVDV